MWRRPRWGGGGRGDLKPRLRGSAFSFWVVASTEPFLEETCRGWRCCSNGFQRRVDPFSPPASPHSFPPASGMSAAGTPPEHPRSLGRLPNHSPANVGAASGPRLMEIGSPSPRQPGELGTLLTRLDSRVGRMG